jgi:hypothetical protein
MGVEVRLALTLLAACAGRGAGEPARTVVAEPASTGIPYGFWGLNGFVSPTGLAALHARLGMTMVQTASTDPKWVVEHLLPMAREAQVRVGLRLSGSHERYTTAEGDFDLAAWKAMIAPWAGTGLDPFVADGTLAGHMILDDIDRFAGRDPDAADLDEMARYSKQLIPGLMTFVREEASDLPVPETGGYLWVDAAVNQYKVEEGDVTAYVAHQGEVGRTLGVGTIHGLNIANGGDGTSEQPGYQAGHWAMSAAEIERYGAALLADPACGMFLNWEYDAEEPWSDGSFGADYFARPELEAALAALGDSARAHEPVTLLRP